MYYPDKPRSVSGAAVVLGVTTVLLSLNIVVALFSNSYALTSYVVVIAITVLVGVGSGKSSASRAWGLAGGWILIGFALLVLVLIPSMRDQVYSDDIKSAVTWVALITALVYGGLGIAAVTLLCRPSANRYYEEYESPSVPSRYSERRPDQQAR